MANTADKQTGNKDRQPDIETEIEREIDEAAGEITSSAGEEDPGSAAEDFVIEHLKKKQPHKES